MSPQVINFLVTILTFAVLSSAAIKFILRYNVKDIKQAGWKALFLWLVSTSPVLTNILLSTPKNGDEELWEQFVQEILRRLTLTEMFVYTAAFLAPMLYVVFEVLDAYNNNKIELTIREVSQEMRGIDKVFITSMIILILTIIAYSAGNADGDMFSNTYLAIFLQQKGYILYLASLLIWFSVILWEKGPPPFSFETAQKLEAGNFADELAKRRGE